MRGTRDLLRHRMHLVHKRAKLLAPVPSNQAGTRRRLLTTPGPKGGKKNSSQDQFAS